MKTNSIIPAIAPAPATRIASQQPLRAAVGPRVPQQPGDAGEPGPAPETLCTGGPPPVRYWIGTQFLATILRAARDLIHLIQAAEAPFALPRETSQKLRTPPYWPDFAFRRLHATPL